MDLVVLVAPPVVGVVAHDPTLVRVDGEGGRKVVGKRLRKEVVDDDMRERLGVLVSARRVHRETRIPRVVERSRWTDSDDVLHLLPPSGINLR